MADQALRELLEVSPQVEAALIADRAGKPIASSLSAKGAGGSASAERLGELVVKLLTQSEKARVELGREPITQCEVGTGQGNVFVVSDATHVVAAVTGNEPTVGLVFYDLKTALRTVREAGTSGGNGDGSSNGSGSGKTAKGAQA